MPEQILWKARVAFASFRPIPPCRIRLPKDRFSDPLLNADAWRDTFRRMCRPRASTNSLHVRRFPPNQYHEKPLKTGKTGRGRRNLARASGRAGCCPFRSLSARLVKRLSWAAYETEQAVRHLQDQGNPF